MAIVNQGRGSLGFKKTRLIQILNPGATGSSRRDFQLPKMIVPVIS